MGTIIIKSKYECCISESSLQESEETEENILEEPLKETVEAFKTLPVLPKIT